MKSGAKGNGILSGYRPISFFHVGVELVQPYLKNIRGRQTPSSAPYHLLIPCPARYFN